MHLRPLSAPDPAVFSVVLLTDAGLDPSRTALPALNLTAADTEPEATRMLFDGSRQAVILGLGLTAKLDGEKLRKAVQQAVNLANKHKADRLQLVALGLLGHPDTETLGLALGEMPRLANYQFLTYYKEPKLNTLKTTEVLTDLVQADRWLAYGDALAQAVCLARDLVNEPPNVLDQQELSRRAVKLATEAGLKTVTLSKTEMEQLGMGGLLAVNRGSHVDPTFTILEHAPADARNSKPLVLVGKGIVFDTGGLSLKPATSMVGMKGDMAGAATVLGTLLAVAQAKLPYRVVGLIPSTDNRPGNLAYTPNDIIRMMDGTHVEVQNTDAEGRMILADALVYAQRYEPALVIDLATLTGAAVVALGPTTTAAYHKDAEQALERLRLVGERLGERLWPMPLWDEFREQLKSDCADLKNIGGKYGGSITAAKFLEHFTKYPWIHLDIAGPAMLESPAGWMPKNGTGWGVRLLAEFIRTYD